MDAKFNPQIKNVSEKNKYLLTFQLSGIDVSIANSIRRVVIANIPTAVFRVEPYSQSKATVEINTTGLTNEILLQRLSCIPIHIQELENINISDYYLDLNIVNDSETELKITTENFVIKRKHDNEPISKNELYEMFPPNVLTKQYIHLATLKGKPSNELESKKLKLKCELDIGTSSENSCFAVSSSCYFVNTIDLKTQQTNLEIMKNKWEKENKTTKEIEFEEKNWKLLEGKRFYIQNSFDFTIESVGVYSSKFLFNKACKILITKLETLKSYFENKTESFQESKLSSMKNCFELHLQNEDETIGYVISNYMNYLLNKDISFCAYCKEHPLDNTSVFRIAYNEPVEIDFVNGNFVNCLNKIIELYNLIKKQMK